MKEHSGRDEERPYFLVCLAAEDLQQVQIIADNG
jgi:hypothetical protein